MKQKVFKTRTLLDKQNKFIEPTNHLIDIFIDGDWETNHEDKPGKSPIVIFNKGKHVQILREQYDEYIEALEKKVLIVICVLICTHILNGMG